ncbi:ISNCY family transposase [Thiorhodospira sibirica]|uniref:ISNCY family transposase n=1 Tax=Thiorhodospira sibirica TaxID=154347 RepID=UPI001FE5F831
MTKEHITMSHKEIDRLEMIQAVANKHLRQAEAAQRLGLSVRQVKRLVRRYREHGATGLRSGHRGRRPNNAIAETVRQEVLALVKTHYTDFGPTLACEKLAERHGHHLSVETLRQWMVADGLWQPKQRKQARIHQRRPRRPCLGELIQIDGSPHDWFEVRGPRCTLIVFIDDATGRLMALRFVPAETTQAYMETLQQYLDQHGRPVALYSDKHSIFRVNHPEHDGELTQFSRALKTLDIAAIHANTPQAKGRVERANQTLQDRLVKELRLREISDIDAANAFLPTFMADFNARFAVEPQSPQDAHRPVLHSPEEQALILCMHHTRKLSKNLCFQFKNREYQLQGQGKGYRLRGATLTVCEAFDGTITLLHQGHIMPYRLLAEGEPPTPLDDEKSVHHSVDQAKAKQTAKPTYKPAPDHPWRGRGNITPAPAQTP